jgi:hypothetical protein
MTLENSEKSQSIFKKRMAHCRQYDTMSASEPTRLRDWRAANVDHEALLGDIIIIKKAAYATFVPHHVASSDDFG